MIHILLCGILFLFVRYMPILQTWDHSIIAMLTVGIYIGLRFLYEAVTSGGVGPIGLMVVFAVGASQVMGCEVNIICLETRFPTAIHGVIQWPIFIGGVVLGVVFIRDFFGSGKGNKSEWYDED